MTGDARWYEAAFVVGITNALNVVADGLAPAGRPPLLAPVEETDPSDQVRALFAEVREFYAGAVPLPLRVVARDPGYAGDLWAAVRRAFADNTLPRRFKEALAFAVSLTTRSEFGTAFHLGEMRRLGVGEGGVMEVIGVTQMFSSYTKIADTLQLDPDMGDIAPVDSTPVPDPGGVQP
jgi:alkylhydroperoxidase/carboxymuconolactone decarboxylase family protein YurZ